MSEVTALEAPPPAPIVPRLPWNELEAMTPERRLDYERRWREQVAAGDARAAARLAEIDRETALRFPDLVEVGTVNDVTLRKLAESCDSAFDLARRGPPRGQPGWREEWSTPHRQLDHERAQLRRRLGETFDPVERARSLVGYRDRWLTIGQLSEHERRQLQAREDLASTLVADRLKVEAEQASAAAMGHVATPWSATRWLADFSGRGGHIAVTASGKLRAGPLALLTEDDRRTLIDRRAELAEALSDDVEF